MPARPAEVATPSTTPAPTAARLDAEQAVGALEAGRPRDPEAPVSSALTEGPGSGAGGGLLGFLRGLLGQPRDPPAPPRPPARTAARPTPSPTLQQTVLSSRGAGALAPADRALLARMLTDRSPLAVQQQGALLELTRSQDWADMTATQQKDALLERTRPFETKLGLEASPAWRVLGDDVKAPMIGRLNQPGQEHYADVVGRMLKTQGFRNRDAAEQAKLLRAQEPLSAKPAQPKDPGVRAAQRTLQAQPAAADLDATTRQRLDTLLAGSRNAYGASARSELVKRTADPVYPIMTRAEQAEYLAEIARGTTAAPRQIIVLDAARRTPAAHRLTVSGQPDAYTFPGVERDATERRLQIGDQSIPIVSARGAPVANQTSPEDMASALATLPPEVRSAIRKVQLSPVRNPGDAYWEKTFNMKGFRAAATATKDGVINIYPAASGTRSAHTQAGYLAHEAGHLIAYDTFGRDVGGPGWQRYSAAAKADGLVCSRYAGGNIDEDFAETLQLYLTHRGQPDFGELRQLFPARFALIDEILAARASAGQSARRRP